MMTKLTKARRDALKQIAAREGTFHRRTGDALERAGLAYPVSGLFNFIANCNCRCASGWVLTEAGANALGLEAL